MARCGTCGADWDEGHYTEACEMCGGGALLKECPGCAGRCGNLWSRAIEDSWELRKAVWVGQCASSEPQAHGELLSLGLIGRVCPLCGGRCDSFWRCAIYDPDGARKAVLVGQCRSRSKVPCEPLLRYGDELVLKDVHADPVSEATLLQGRIITKLERLGWSPMTAHYMFAKNVFFDRMEAYLVESYPSGTPEGTRRAKQLVSIVRPLLRDLRRVLYTDSRK